MTSSRRLLWITLSGAALAAGVIAVCAGRPRDSIVEAQQYLESGLAAHAVGQFARAIELFDLALAHDATLVPALLARGNARRGVDDLEAALVDYDRIIAMDANHVEAHLARARVLMGLRRDAEMFEELDLVLSFEEDHVIARDLRAWMLYNAREYERSLADFDILIGQGTTASRNDLSNWLGRRAEARRAAGDDAGAIEDLDRLLAMNGTDAEAMRSSAWALWGLGRYEEALVRFDEASVAQPRTRHLYLGRALTLFFLGRFEEAEPKFERMSEFLRQGAPRESVFFLYLCRARLGRPGDTPTDAWRANHFTAWQSRVVSFVGDMDDALDETAFLREAESEGEGASCDALYYAGMKRLLSGDDAGGAELLDRCVATGEREFYEYHAATAELRRMGKL